MNTPEGESPGPSLPYDADPREFQLSTPWRIGHTPEDPSEWALETRLRLDEVEKTREWATGRRPENDREWQLEYSFRELERMKQQQNLQSEVQFRVALESANQSARSTNVRSWVLLAIVASIILMPAIAMGVGIAPQSFSQYIAPITGIAGTVLGYWFSQQGASGMSSEKTQDGSSGTPSKIPEFPSPPQH